MKISNFEVQVTSPEGVPFYEVLDPHTREVYVVAEAGKMFELRYKATLYSNLRPGHSLFVRTRIDGKTTGVSSILAGRSDSGVLEAKHIGFVRHGDKHGIQYDLFKFASATADEGIEARSLEFQQGRIEVNIHETVEQVGKTVDHSNVGPTKVAKVPSLPEGKKFFLAPSLTTASAGVQSSSHGFSSRTYVDVGPPKASFRFRYETASTLLLRKILRPENPAHAAILNSFPETRIRSENEQPQGSVMGSSAPAHQHPRVKRERAIKTEIVDLVDPNRVSIRVVENLAPNEELTCDLTGDEDAPRWQKRLKPDIELDD